MSRSSTEGKVYVGNLPPDVKQRDIEDLFYKFGKIVNINLKNANAQPFAFIEFEDHRYKFDNIIKDALIEHLFTFLSRTTSS